MKLAFTISAALVLVFGLVVDLQWLPLGVPSEWDWERMPRASLPAWSSYLPAVLWGAALVAWVATGVRWVEGAGRAVFFGGLLATTALAGAFQIASEAPNGRGLGKWIVAVYAPQVTGFFQLARHAPPRPADVFNDYPALISQLPPGHISANPPGWVIIDRAVIDFFHDAGRRRLMRSLEPAVLGAAFERLAPAAGAAPEERPAAVAIALASRIASLLVILPAAWLALLRFGRWGAWLAAGAAGMIPADILFAPRCDCVYATAATLAIALAHHAAAPHTVARRRSASAFACGLLIALGMLFSLCFVVAAAMCAAVMAASWLVQRKLERRVAIAFAAGWVSVPLAVLLITGCNISHIWLANLAKNAQFNQLTHRTYWIWAMVNPIEFSVALGLPAAVLLVKRLASEISPRLTAARDPVPVAWLAVMLLLNLSGSNRAEVARLWIFMMPVAAALAFESLPKDWRTAAAFLGLQCVACIMLCRELTVM